MIAERFHKINDGKLRGDVRPARLRMASRRGVTLVELLISMLILAIVCIAWLEIIGIQSARKEARRREAVERLAGMMDAFMYLNRENAGIGLGSYCCMFPNGHEIVFVKDGTTNDVHSVFDGSISPVGYQLCVVEKKDLSDTNLFTGWNTTRGIKGYWLVGRLYDQNGAIGDVGKPFFTMPVCLGL